MLPSDDSRCGWYDLLPEPGPARWDALRRRWEIDAVYD